MNEWINNRAKGIKQIGKKMQEEKLSTFFYFKEYQWQYNALGNAVCVYGPI